MKDVSLSEQLLEINDAIMYALTHYRNVKLPSFYTQIEWIEWFNLSNVEVYENPFNSFIKIALSERSIPGGSDIGIVYTTADRSMIVFDHHMESSFVGQLQMTEDEFRHKVRELYDSIIDYVD